MLLSLSSFENPFYRLNWSSSRSDTAVSPNKKLSMDRSSLRIVFCFSLEVTKLLEQMIGRYFLSWSTEVWMNRIA